ncbi:MFS transporter [uncultured Ruthenibacterium sp.]|uniref:MFS transporter n=1 Tax=uncultured Ruthenibacterium sp. TaxID=1905347 RepID=UPI002592F407|nr:MFS transporter [uncultured Ruthenibacterium sp.]
MASEAKTQSTVPKLKFKNVIGYGCGDAGGVITLYMVAMYMSRYLQVTLQVNPAILATMLLVWNVWDTVNDPLMGTLMDITYAKAKPGKDKFRPWILLSIPFIVIGMIAFYGIPARLGGGIPMLIALFILKIIYEGGYTMMNIGMGSLLGAMSTNDTERATLASARGMGSTVGGMVAGFVIPQVLARVGETTDGYFVAAVIAACLGGFIIFLHYALTVERNKAAQQKVQTAEEKAASKFKLSDIWGIFAHNRAFLALVLHSISITAVQALGQGATLYMYADVLGDIGLQGYASILSSVLMITILLSAPLLTKKWDLVGIIRFCLIVGAAMYGVMLVYSLMVTEMNAWFFVIWQSIAAGMVTMSVQMQWGLVAESIDYNEYLTGKRNEGTIYGFFSLSRRIGSTITGSLTVLLIAAIGYNPELANTGMQQAAGTITGIKWMVIGFPLLAALLSFLSFTFIWNINKDIRDKMTAWKLGKTAE